MTPYNEHLIVQLIGQGVGLYSRLHSVPSGKMKVFQRQGRRRNDEDLIVLLVHWLGFFFVVVYFVLFLLVCLIVLFVLD